MCLLVMQEDVEVKYNYPGNLPLPTTRDKRLVFEGYGSYGGFLVQVTLFNDFQI